MDKNYLGEIKGEPTNLNVNPIQNPLLAFKMNDPQVL